LSVARRYGGAYSPDPSTTESDRPAVRAEINPAGARANLLFVPPVLLVLTTLTGGAVPMALGLAGAGVLTGAAFLLRAGLEAEAEYNSRRAARRPAIPRKLFAAITTGLGTALAVAAHQEELGLAAPAIFGLVTGALHAIAFGPDPWRNKGMEGIDTFQQDRVARVVDEADRHLAAMRAAVARAGDRKAEARLERFEQSVRDMVRTVEEDPRDLTAARKYLGVYLMGARDASEKFADLMGRAPDPEARRKYIELLDDLDRNFAAKTRKLMADTHTDLDIEIGVLRDRLAREGVRLDTDTQRQPDPAPRPDPRKEA
jgi:hypothetical protein